MKRHRLTKCCCCFRLSCEKFTLTAEPFDFKQQDGKTTTLQTAGFPLQSAKASQRTLHSAEYYRLICNLQM